MSEICFAVECFKNKIRYTYSQILADKWAKQYNSEVELAFLIPKILIEPRGTDEKNFNPHLDETNQD